MKANLAPLVGKYYGTKILLDTGDEITVWLSGSTPSDREFFNPEWRGEDGEFHYEFPHCENETTYRVAQLIVEAINNTHKRL